MAPTTSMAPRIVPLRSVPLIDDPVDSVVEGLPPGRRVTVRAGSTDANGRQFSSWAEYEIGERGVVNLGEQPPVTGSYSGADPFGLWWSMEHAKTDRQFIVGLEPVPTTLAAEIDGAVVAAVSFERRRLAEGVTVQPLRDRGLEGMLFSPPGGPAPGVLVLGGSAGGFHWSQETAALLASHGFAALALAYFGGPGLPFSLAHIPVEYFGSALAWLCRHDGVSSAGIGVIGASRGGELALLVGATHPEVNAVVSLSGSGVLWGGIRVDRPDPVAAWTWEGSVLPHLDLDRPRLIEAREQSPIGLTEVFLDAMTDSRSLEDATVAVERIRGPVLLISGERDATCPATELSQIALDRLVARGHPFPDQHLRYADAGHLTDPPGLPLDSLLQRNPWDRRLYALGGFSAANAAARADLWPRVLAFLREHTA
ncbi:MAG: acyl-CoA thioesterase/bile acid-CoA:amino acid N-acyltransferase family protein [Candidatus Dormibacteria bacterium]